MFLYSLLQLRILFFVQRFGLFPPREPAIIRPLLFPLCQKTVVYPTSEKLCACFNVRRRILSISLTTGLCVLTFRHRASSILGQEFHYSPENAFYIFNQQIYFII